MKKLVVLFTNGIQHFLNKPLFVRLFFLGYRFGIKRMLNFQLQYEITTLKI